VRPLFREKTDITIKNGIEVKNVVLSKKMKILIASVVAITVVCLIAVPYVAAQTSANPITTTKTLHAKGYAYQSISSDTIKKYNANFSLTLVQTANDAYTLLMAAPIRR
jgi:hypothetical protein